ncbi:MAG: hypothetical protein V1668_04955 [Patescibacteria group bacterium]
MALAPLFDKDLKADECQTPITGDMRSCALTEDALKWVVSHCKIGSKELLVVIDIGGGIGSRLNFISQLKRMPVSIPIVLVADHEARLDDRLRSLGFDIILTRSEMEPVCRMKLSHPASVDLCRYAFLWPKMDDGITLDGITLKDIIWDIIECQCIGPRRMVS